jgi:PPM family protein phosphatase
MLRAHGVSHPGRVRKINEDSWLSDPELGLFVVADGMGGHNAGEVASQLAVESIHGFMQRTAGTEDLTWPYGFEASLSYSANRVRSGIKLANRRVFRASESRGEYTGMGTTIVVVLAADGMLTYGAVGDSRLYWFDANGLTQMTTDDSWTALVEREGVAPGSSHPMRHVLTNAVGARETVEFEIRERAMSPEAMLLLCTDGLYNEATSEQISAVLARGGGPDEAARALVDLGLTSAAKDNLTALVVAMKP